jgi:glycosyltransferase involved in cell wall biosynthesis
VTKKSFHILLDATVVNDKPTGVGRAVLELIVAISELNIDIKFTVAVSTQAPFSFLEEKDNWNIVEVKFSTPRFFQRIFVTQLEVPLIAKKLDVDLVHFMTMPSSLWLHCPSVMTVMDVAFHRFPESVDYLRRIYYKSIMKQSIRTTDAIITISNSSAKEIGELYPSALPKTFVTMLGLPRWTRIGKVNPMRDKSAPLLFVGSLEPRKNLDRILDAYLRFRKRNPESDLPILTIVGGRGWLDEKLVARILLLEKQQLVTWTRYCSTEKLIDIYQSSSALLFPSLHEGFGFPILESMAFNLPVITSDRGAMKEVSGGATLLVNPDCTDSITHAIERLYFDRNIASQLVESGQERYRQFDWHQTAVETADVYKQKLLLQ